MNLGSIPVSSSRERDQKQPVHQIDSSQLKLMLFPGQIQKISSLIALLAHQRELMTRLDQRHQDSNLSLVDDFMWKSQLQYYFTNDTKQVPVKVSSNNICSLI
jgi:dynein heavy chain